MYRQPDGKQFVSGGRRIKPKISETRQANQANQANLLENGAFRINS